MSTGDLSQAKKKVGVVLVKGCGCTEAASAAPVARAQSLLQTVSSESGIPVALKVITTQQAVQGALPASLLAQGWEIWGRLNWRMLPAIIVDGKVVSTGEASAEVVRKALVDASRA